MTGSENERLAVVETKVSTLLDDVSEIKADVKLLLAARSRFTGMGDMWLRALPFVALGVSFWAVAAR